MAHPAEKDYYIQQQPALLDRLDKEAGYWRPCIAARCGEKVAGEILAAARREFAALVPQIPYIGGEANRLTKSLVESVQYLALYQAMQKYGRTAAETGRIVHDAYLAKAAAPKPPIPPAERLTPAQMMARRRKAAEESQARRYPGDYVYTFVPGDGREFDYGYDFTECASLKFYQAQGAEEFLPYYCHLDFLASKAQGIGFTRTMSLLAGEGKCNHRFKVGGETIITWPPALAKED